MINDGEIAVCSRGFHGQFLRRVFLVITSIEGLGHARGRLGRTNALEEGQILPDHATKTHGAVDATRPISRQRQLLGRWKLTVPPSRHAGACGPKGGDSNEWTRSCLTRKGKIERGKLREKKEERKRGGGLVHLAGSHLGLFKLFKLLFLSQCFRFFALTPKFLTSITL